MRMINTLLLFLVISFTACKESSRQLTGTTEDETNTATTFIRAALDGDYEKARTLIVNDSLNQQDLDASERLYKERMTAEEKAKYRGASIHIHETKNIDSATSIIYFSNTYRNQVDSLKVVKINGKWLVDFKFIFKHKPDSLQ